jgi:carbonic anhydrase
MCTQCDQLNRRRFMSLGAAGAAATVLGLTLPVGTAFAKTELTADEALQKLKEGNRRFMTEPDKCEADMNKVRENVAEGQSPWATILGCADSRVAPELIFGGMTLGELFVCRNAGNMADVATLGTIEYGAEHLGSPLIVVLGHERCGAVKAACDVAENGTELPGHIKLMVDEIVPTAKDLLGKDGDFVDNVVIESARRTADLIRTESEIVAELAKEGKVKVVYARYDLDSGEVTFFD